MNKSISIALAVSLLSLGGCATPGIGPAGDTPAPSVAKSHPRYAPPPGVESHWEAGLGVYVLDDERDTYYRERTYYRWNNGWSWASNPQGPWQPTDSNGVPPGLYRRYAQ